MIQGAFEAAVMYKMRELRGEVKYQDIDILKSAKDFIDLYNANKHYSDKPIRDELFITLAAMIGNMLED
jgi:hypothetical protein